MGRLLSVIVPVYNTPLDKLQRCITSVLAIHSLESEVIVINDGCAQEFSEAYEHYLCHLNSERIRYVVQENMGVSEARNRGILQASGEYIMMVDSDDEVIPDSFGDEYCADLIIFQRVFTKGRSQKQLIQPIYPGVSGEVPFPEFAWLVACGKFRGSCGFLYKRDFLMEHNIRYEKGCIQGEDADFNFRFMLNRPSVQYIAKPIYVYMFSTATTRSRWEKMPEKMISSGAARFEQALACLPELFPEDNRWRKRELIQNRIHDIYRSSIELCCAGQATVDNKKEIERLMSAVAFPADMDGKSKRQYLDVVNRRWGKLACIAKLRQIYLWITGV